MGTNSGGTLGETPIEREVKNAADLKLRKPSPRKDRAAIKKGEKTNLETKKAAMSSTQGGSWERKKKPARPHNKEG